MPERFAEKSTNAFFCHRHGVSDTDTPTNIDIRTSLHCVSILAYEMLLNASCLKNNHIWQINYENYDTLMSFLEKKCMILF